MPVTQKFYELIKSYFRTMDLHVVLLTYDREEFIWTPTLFGYKKQTIYTNKKPIFRDLYEINCVGYLRKKINSFHLYTYKYHESWLQTNINAWAIIDSNNETLAHGRVSGHLNKNFNRKYVTLDIKVQMDSVTLL